MPFVNSASQREVLQSATPAEYYEETPWWDGYAAAVGVVIDEELSISSALNREGWRDREKIVKELGIDTSKYTKTTLKSEYEVDQRIDYDRIALEYDQVKTDSQLNAERNDYLRMKREFSQQELKDAPASAQFIGAMSGYLLDPISILTMPVSVSVKGAQGMSVLSRVGKTAGRAAVVEGATEAVIQPFVFQHKQEIGAEYTAQEAIQNIATAAAGAAALSGVTGGIAGYLRKFTENVDAETLSKGDRVAYDSVKRMEDILEDAPDDTVEGQARFLNETEDYKTTYNSRVYEPEPIVDQPIPAAEKTTKQSEILERTGLQDGYDQAAKEYAELPTRIISDGEDTIDADAVVKGFDDELSGLDNVMRCVRG